MNKTLTTCVVLGAVVCLPGISLAQVTLPSITVTGDISSTSLTVADTETARANINRIAGGAEVVSDATFRNGPAQTVKDMLGWVPGVYVQPRFGDDARISIRGSGISRNYGNRGLNMYVDGIPLNTSDGLVDNFDIDPTAYRYVEVYKGANALRYGGNSLGGAINFVTPTGRDAAPFEARVDAGSFGYLKSQASTGGYDERVDYFITASAQRFDGYRDHSEGNQQRLASNLGIRFSADAETRFYLSVNRTRQRLPGEVTKRDALDRPRRAAAEFELLDQRRDIDSFRVANKTTLRFGNTTVDVGVFGIHRHVMHPIYQWLDYKVNDYGGFMRAEHEGKIGVFRNLLTTGVNLHKGGIDTDQYINLPGGHKGALATAMYDKSTNMSAYAENSFFIQPDIALIAGAHFQHSVRDREDRFLADGDQSGRRSYDNFSPKFGVLWDITPAWQAFANVSRSAEVPTFDANSFATPGTSNLKAQRATTYEIGTRGREQDFHWDISLYQARVKNELQCLTTAPWSPCSVVNADRTRHQGIEAGLGAVILKSALTEGDRVWFNATYTYSDFRFDGDARYGNNRLPGIPEHALRGEILYKHPSGFYGGPSVEWMPRAYFADNDNRETVDPYALFNVKVGYAGNKAGWSGYLEGRNLLDKRYIANVAVAGSATAASALYHPGTGRSVYGGMQYRW